MTGLAVSTLYVTKRAGLVLPKIVFQVSVAPTNLVRCNRSVQDVVFCALLEELHQIGAQGGVAHHSRIDLPKKLVAEPDVALSRVRDHPARRTRFRTRVRKEEAEGQCAGLGDGRQRDRYVIDLKWRLHPCGR